MCSFPYQVELIFFNENKSKRLVACGTECTSPWCTIEPQLTCFLSTLSTPPPHTQQLPIQLQEDFRIVLVSQLTIVASPPLSYQPVLTLCLFYSMHNSFCFLVLTPHLLFSHCPLSTSPLALGGSVSSLFLDS